MTKSKMVYFRKKTVIDKTVNQSIPLKKGGLTDSFVNL